MRSLAIITILLLGVSAFAQLSVNAKAVTLFRLATVPAAVDLAQKSSIASKREAEITFGSEVMSSVSHAASLSLSLFDGKSFEASRTGTETRSLDNVTWRGKISLEKFHGDVVLTFYKGYAAGLIYSPDAVYEIVPRGDRHFLVELDQTAFPECAGDVKGEPAAPTAAPSASVDSGDRIDVLVLYTAAVRNSLGGDAQAQTVAQQAIDATNTAYINSRIRQRVQLVGAQLTSLSETGDFGTELSNLRGSSEAATARNNAKADLVDMLTNSTAACGIGYLMGGAGGNQNNGFTVTARTCAVGNLSFAHELGHNMGSQHNPENGSNPTYPYGFGHYVNGSYRTVMSYSDPCTSGCTRVAYFSNPNIVFNGFPTGISNARDNARSINNTADWIANYRYSGANVMLGVLNSGEVVRRVAALPISWTSENFDSDVSIELSRDEGVTWETLVTSTANDGSEVVRITGRPTQQARVRVTSLGNRLISDSSVKNFTIR